MALKPDDTVCFCFHVSLRKIETFCRREKPAAPSEISECLSAGTGCGWCVPILQKIHHQICGEHLPWWRTTPTPTTPTAPPAPPTPSLEDLTPESHKAGRSTYLKDGKGTPPPGAEV